MKKLENKKGKKTYSTPQTTMIPMETVRFFASSGKSPNDFQNGGYYGRTSTPASIWD